MPYADCDRSIKMKVFVTGSTGFVGRYVVADLVAKGYDVFAGVRDIAKVSGIFGNQVAPAKTDFADKNSLRKTLLTVMPDAIVHLIGIISEVPSKGITFEQVHRQLPADLYQVAGELGIRKVVHMSALGVHPDAPSHYHRTKLMAEQNLRSSGLIYTIFRPSVIIGPGQKLFSDLRKFTGIAPVVPLPGGGKHLMQPVDVRDAACAFVSALEKSETDNRVYELCGQDVMSFRSILDAVFLVWRKKVYYLNVPERAMMWVGRIAESIMANPPVSSDLVRMMWKDNVCGLYGDADTDGVRAVCGRSPVPLLESLDWSLAQNKL
jgi:uncharacterized protein YbjT (DUF2867 family)